MAYYFPPRGGAPVQRSLKFVKYLREFGWEPTVLTTRFERGGAADDSLAGEIPPGTKVVEVPSRERLFIRLAEKGLGRLVGLLLRPDAHIEWAGKAAGAGFGLHNEEPFDLVYTSLQPWSAGYVGLRLSRLARLPWVCDFRDPWTESLHLEWPSRRHFLADRRRERLFLSIAERSLVVTPTMRDEFLAAHPDLAAERVAVLYNGYDEDDMSGPPAADDGRFTVVFTGRFQYDWGESALDGPPGGRLRSRARDLLTYKPRRARIDTHSPVYFLRALAGLLSDRPELRADFRVVFAGTVGEGNRRLIRELGLGDVVECPGYLPHRESVALVRSADALLLPMFSGRAGERVAYASGKVFEYIAARKPIITLAPEGDAREIASRSRLGFPAEPDDPDDIRRVVEGIYQSWKSGRPAASPDEEYIRSFRRRELTGRLASIFDEVLEGG